MADEKYGNAGALGFIGFGLATTLLALNLAGVYDGGGAMLLGMYIFVGGFLEIAAGLMLWKMGDSFASLAFSAFGFFWLSLAAIIIAPLFGIAAPSGDAVAAYQVMWGILAFGLGIAALKAAPRTVTFLLLALALLFWLLALGNAGNGNADILKIAGYLGIIDGMSGIYITLAMTVNSMWGKDLLPLLAPKAK